MGQDPPAQSLYGRLTVRSGIPLEDLLEAVEDVFVDYARGRAQMPAKNYLQFPSHDGDLRTMSAYVPAMGLATVKVVNAHPNNPAEHDLPTVMALLVAVDPATGVPRAVMDATEITALRTAAASALATRVMAPAEAEVLGLIGAGAQGMYQVRGQRLVREFKRLLIHDRDAQRARELADEVRTEFPDLTVEVVEDPRTLLQNAGVINSLTPTRTPLIDDLDTGGLPERLHVNAMGADAPEKQEWPAALLEEFEVVVDDREQASHSGEISGAVDDGRLGRNDLGTLGELLLQETPRTGPRTLFDSTGLAIQDTAAAAVLLQGEAAPDAAFPFLTGPSGGVG